MRSSVSREKRSITRACARCLRAERERKGHIVWVMGPPAVLHARGRDCDLVVHPERLCQRGCSAQCPSVVHDIEQALMAHAGHGSHGRPIAGRPCFHMRATTDRGGRLDPRRVVDQGLLKGIMYTAEVRRAVRARDRSAMTGRCPTRSAGVVRAQELMRVHAQKATMAIMVATALHSIAFGNMLPAYRHRARTGRCVRSPPSPWTPRNFGQQAQGSRNASGVWRNHER